jgi:hypothetical protein
LRLFEHLGIVPIMLEKIGADEYKLRTGLRFRVVK